jgi:hypothetical protein
LFCPTLRLLDLRRDTRPNGTGPGALAEVRANIDPDAPIMLGFDNESELRQVVVGAA